MEQQSVLITGGSGLVGKYLTSLLLEAGYKVSHLSRSSNSFGRVRVYRWNPDKQIADPLIFEGVDYVIHLAGANIGEKRWTKKRKEEIINSRVQSARFLYKMVCENKTQLKAFITASATGYYGSITSERIFVEEDPASADFLGTTCWLWEEAADLFKETGIRTVKIRTAVVLEKSDSALSKLLIPARIGVFPRLGNGRQYMPWIHIKDLCGIYLKAIQDEKMAGAYNAVSPQHITQSEFMRALAQVMKKPFFHPSVPSIFLKTALGEMSNVVLKGSRVSAGKIKNSEYSFIYPELDGALKNIIQ